MIFKRRKSKKFLKLLKEGHPKDYTEEHLIGAIIDGDEEKAQEILDHLVRKEVNKI